MLFLLIITELLTFKLQFMDINIGNYYFTILNTHIILIVVFFIIMGYVIIKRKKKKNTKS